MNEPTNPEEPMPTNDTYDPYPGGSDAPAYRLAFQVWTVMFLVTICAGLLIFLGTWWKG